MQIKVSTPTPGSCVNDDVKVQNLTKLVIRSLVWLLIPWEVIAYNQEITTMTVSPLQPKWNVPNQNTPTVTLSVTSGVKEERKKGHKIIWRNNSLGRRTKESSITDFLREIFLVPLVIKTYQTDEKEKGQQTTTTESYQGTIIFK